MPASFLTDKLSFPFSRIFTLSKSTYLQRISSQEKYALVPEKTFCPVTDDRRSNSYPFHQNKGVRVKLIV